MSSNNANECNEKYTNLFARLIQYSLSLYVHMCVCVNMQHYNQRFRLVKSTRLTAMNTNKLYMHIEGKFGICSNYHRLIEERKNEEAITFE